MPTRAKAVRKTTATLLLIALFKLIKGILLLAVGIGALKLLHRDVAQTVSHWVDILRVDPENRIIHRLLTRVLSVTPAQLRAASAGTFPTDTPLFAGLLVGVVVIVGALTFFPALSLGPILEHLLMNAGKVF